MLQRLDCGASRSYALRRQRRLVIIAAHCSISEVWTLGCPQFHLTIAIETQHGAVWKNGTLLICDLAVSVERHLPCVGIENAKSEFYERSVLRLREIFFRQAV